MKVESHLPGEAAPERRAGHACLRGNGPGPRPPRRPPGRRAVAGKANIPYLLFWVSLVVVTYFGMNALTAPTIAKVAVSNNGALETYFTKLEGEHRKLKRWIYVLVALLGASVALQLGRWFLLDTL